MTNFSFDDNQSLEAIEKEEWKEPDLKSSLVERVLSIRKKAIKNLTIEEVRLMVGQQFSLEYISPKALQILEENPFAEGDLYSGDLLVSVLSVKKEFWIMNPVLHGRLLKILKQAKDDLPQIDEGDRQLIMRALEAYDAR